MCLNSTQHSTPSTTKFETWNFLAASHPSPFPPHPHPAIPHTPPNTSKYCKNQTPPPNHDKVTSSIIILTHTLNSYQWLPSMWKTNTQSPCTMVSQHCQTGVHPKLSPFNATLTKGSLPVTSWETTALKHCGPTLTPYT